MLFLGRETLSSRIMPPLLRAEIVVGGASFDLDKANRMHWID
jgi:hypothetical protein